ncbi:GTP 3',8-cyclase MoaA [Simiduia agarivorans]|uniref:GTP 3',8-cyclase n=1 Tax=Simiduia agarivorans (strain DSM 21679 / JCM 13881 / BCRC 17597 / SA1) TaxID=1117647 RepID=K4KH71_SIMAS|nr:GTP 3',8-cyclase MoaA [Simiduia agarivorans]AFU98454.1 molybdenum cofactor biosynthesis protein [Simiduia agarivorans SA1 = DSM 21679]
MLVDSFGRIIDYIRLSVTDRCDFRCVYCMAEEMTFMPREQVLSLEELVAVGRAFVELGVKKIRITGGEPLVRRGVMKVFDELGQLPLEELTLTTNGSQLPKYASALRAAGVKRINISLDTLDPEKFHQLTRTGQLSQVLDGIKAAQDAGFERIKLNAVILKNRNAAEVPALTRFALEQGLDISFIEEMPLGSIVEHSRALEFCSSAELRALLSQHFSLAPLEDETAGPSRYWRADQYASRIGFISPHSENFCASCNRVRVSAEGKLLLCLGNDHAADLRAVLRAHPGDDKMLKIAIMDAMQHKPERHHFNHSDEPQIVRFMNTTGG